MKKKATQSQQRVYLSQNLIRSLETSLRLFNSRVRLFVSPTNRVALREPTSDLEIDGDYIAEVFTRTGAPTPLFFSFDATFFKHEDEQAPSLRTASLKVLHRITSDYTPLFRAEWDEQDATSTTEHAQPHWHFTQEPERIAQIARRLLRPAEVVEFVPDEPQRVLPPLIDCGKIHFAMISPWGKNEPLTEKHLFNSDDFPRWFAGLSGYLASQIDHVVLKMPSGVLEFRARE